MSHLSHIQSEMELMAKAWMGVRAIYASTLAYIVDANPGRSSSAISCNSMARGVTACIFSFIALPIRVSRTMSRTCIPS